jgi:hypothetical protein
MLSGVPKKPNTFPPRTSKSRTAVQAEPAMEVTPEPRNAELAMSVTESGRLSVFRELQAPKHKCGMVVIRDGVSNVTDDNAEH